MISFKEYTLLSFQNFIEERVRNFLLGTISEPALLYNFFNYSEEFLNSLSPQEAIEFFMKENSKMVMTVGDGKGGVEKRDLFSMFKDTLQKNKKYYDILFYYLKENGLPEGISKIKGGLSKQEVSSMAAREIFANEIFKFAKLVNQDISQDLTNKIQASLPQSNVFTTVVSDQAGKNWTYKIGKKDRAVARIPYGDVRQRMFNAVNEMNDNIDENLISLIDNA